MLDSVLAGKEYLVGNKCTYADLSFVTWYWVLSGLEHVVPGIRAELEKENPNWAAWDKKLNERPAVKKAFETREKKIAEGK